MHPNRPDHPLKLRLNGGVMISDGLKEFIDNTYKTKEGAADIIEVFRLYTLSEMSEVTGVKVEILEAIQREFISRRWLS